MRLSDCWYMSFTPNGGACQNPLASKDEKEQGVLARMARAFFPVFLNAPVTLMAQGWISQGYAQAIFPVHKALAMGVESAHIYTQYKQLSQTHAILPVIRMLEGATLMGLTLCSLPAGLMAMTARDLVIECNQSLKFVQEKKYWQVIQSVAKVAIYSLYLACAYYSRTLMLGVAYAGTQVAVNGIQALGSLWKGDWISCAGDLAFAFQQGQRMENLKTADQIISNFSRIKNRVDHFNVFAN